MQRLIGIVLVGMLGWLPARAEEAAVVDAMAEDVVLRAMVDELHRSLDGLALEGLARPYFIEYALLDTSYAWVAAEYGAVTLQNADRSRGLRVDVRVGSYDLDNSNFSAGYGRWGRGSGDGGSVAIPIEDDYDAIRQAIWWMTDRDYKDVSEQLEKKKAFMKSKMIADKPPDFSHEAPTVFLEERACPAFDAAALADLATRLSALFREYPDLQDSGVQISAAAGNAYLVNSEGTRVRTQDARCSIAVSAEVQAEDGMQLSDVLSIDVRDPADLPDYEELAQHCRAMIERLLAVRAAPKLEEAYTGPVLFEKEAAAELFARAFASRFAGGQRPVGSRTSPDDFANKLNRRILPRFMNVVDDPTLERLHDQPVLGHYQYDDQGVPAQRVALVENGRLKALLMSRNPSKEFAQSNGHGRGFYGPSAAPGCLIVTADPASTPDELRAELIEGAQDEGLPFAIRVAALGRSPSNPLVVYKVFPDGREELVRGVEIGQIDLKAFKRIPAAGDDPYVLNSGGRSHSATVVAPALLFEELDLAKIDRDFDQPPILENPLGRE